MDAHPEPGCVWGVGLEKGRPELVCECLQICASSARRFMRTDTAVRYLRLALYVTYENEMARSTVADVGVDGEGPTGVARDDELAERGSGCLGRHAGIAKQVRPNGSHVLLVRHYLDPCSHVHCNHGPPPLPPRLVLQATALPAGQGKPPPPSVAPPPRPRLYVCTSFPVSPELTMCSLLVSLCI